MSDNKNGISPFRNEEYLKSSSSRNNRSAEFRNKVTEKDKNEFNEVFSDDELDSKGHDGSGFFASFRVNSQSQNGPEKTQKASESPPQKAAAPDKPKAAATAQSSDNLYAVPDVNIDALISGLTAGTASQNYVTEKKAVSVKDDSNERTITFAAAPPPKKQHVSEKTRHFSLNSYTKSKAKASNPKPHKKTDIMGGVRVLSGNKMDDEAILETVP